MADNAKLKKGINIKQDVKRPSKIESFFSAKVALPLFIIFIGMYYFAKNLGFIPDTVPFWPIVIVLIGAYWLFQIIYYELAKRKQ